MVWFCFISCPSKMLSTIVPGRIPLERECVSSSIPCPPTARCWSLRMGRVWTGRGSERVCRSRGRSSVAWRRWTEWSPRAFPLCARSTRRLYYSSQVARSINCGVYTPIKIGTLPDNVILFIVYKQYMECYRKLYTITDHCRKFWTSKLYG